MATKSIGWKELPQHWSFYLFVVPTLLLVGLFQYYPSASGVFHSFYRWNGADIAEFVGWENYRDLIGNQKFWDSFRLAFILGFWNVVKMIPALVVAVCIHRCRSSKVQFLYRCLFIIPMVMPGLVVVLIWRTFFFESGSGFLNQFLIKTGLFNVLVWLDHLFHWGGLFEWEKNPSWIGDPRLVVVACILWGFPWVGSFAVLTHLAKLQNIPKEIYEAADIDGVSWWSKFTKIELPALMGSIYLLLVFVIIETIKDAGMILALAGLNGGPGGNATVPALFMLRKAFYEQKMGAACAVGIVLTVIVMALQKLSNVVINWDTLKSKQKKMFRLCMIGLGVLLVGMNQFTAFGVAIIIFSMPCGPVLTRLKNLLFSRRHSVSFVSEEASSSPYRYVPRDISPAARKRKDMFLRISKHLMICSVLLLAVLPLYLMIVVSLKDNTQFYEKPAVLTQPYHWENWKVGWEKVTPAIANTMFTSSYATILTLVFALSSAYFFARMQVPLSRFFWNAILILMMMPTIANLVPLFNLLVNLKLVNTLTALILVGASAGQVFCIFVLRNFVSEIPQDLFEAAEIDGANHWQQLKAVVFPLCGPILGTVGVMQFLHNWNEFVLPLMIMRDEAKLPVMVQIHRLSGEYLKFWGPLMASYAIASIPIIILFIFSMKLFIRGMTEGAVKG